MEHTDVARRFSIAVWKFKPDDVPKKAIDSLVKDGFLEQQTCPRDKRRLEYRLTHRGYVLAEAGIVSVVY